VSAHLVEVYGAGVGKDQVSRITEAVVAELNEWQNRPLDRVYPVVFRRRDRGQGRLIRRSGR
jgi:transposase-like protein